ncbi:MAG: DUF1573 domain-containing protein [Bacteroidaceae bacterium]|nr:DUF1573 domain-containing protein [Bacteroidaceae bacterium]
MNKLNVKLLLVIVLSIMSFSFTSAKKYPEIKFEKTTIDLGTFSQDTPIQKCVFKFKNVGNAPLIINYVHPSCGCTGAEYPKDAIAPGESGEIVVTYDGSGKMPGNFSKYVQVFSNCKDDLTRIFIKGYMSELSPDAIKQEPKTTAEKN